MGIINVKKTEWWLKKKVNKNQEKNVSLSLLFIQTNAVLPEGLMSPGAKRQRTKLRSDNFAVILLFLNCFSLLNLNVTVSVCCPNLEVTIKYGFAKN